METEQLTRTVKTFLVKFTNGQNKTFQLDEWGIFFQLERYTENGESVLDLRVTASDSKNVAFNRESIWKGSRLELSEIVSAVQSAFMQYRMGNIHGS